MVVRTASEGGASAAHSCDLDECTSSASEEELAPPSLATLPKELIEEVLRRTDFDSAAALVNTRRACRAFTLVVIPDESWRRVVCNLLPLPQLWCDYGQLPGSSWLSMYKNLSTCMRNLKDRWTDEYREGYKFGKYSRWAVDRYDSFFCWYLVLAVRIFTSAATSMQLELLEELASGPHQLRYQPLNSTTSQTWWQDINRRLEQLGPSQFLALLLLDRVVSRGLGCGEISIWTENDEGETAEALIERHLRSAWWGADEGEQEKQAARLAHLFDVAEFSALADWLLADANSGALLKQCLSHTPSHHFFVPAPRAPLDPS